MEFLRQFARGIAEAWRRLSLSARINLALAAVLAVALVVGVVYLGARPVMFTLSSGLGPEQANQISAALEQAAIPFERADGYSTIRVPQRFLSDAQLILAEANLPVGRRELPGFELFDQTELMTSQALQDIRYTRAIQGELQRQLNLFEFVDYSHVLIREAREELFASEQRASEAAVTLQVNRPLTKREVQGIVNIVSAAGGSYLTSDNITVATTKGEVLAAPADSEFAAMANNKLDYIVALEKQREAKLLDKLEDMGVRATVSVSARVNFDEEESISREYDEGTELSTYSYTTNLTTEEALPEGAPGALANIPEGEVMPGGTSTEEEMSEEIINYEPSVQMVTTRSGPGEVLQYVTTLVVEGSYEETTDEETGEIISTYAGLTEDQRQLYTALAEATVGGAIEESVVNLYDMPFQVERLTAATAMAEATQAAVIRNRVVEYGWIALQLLLILVAFFMLRRLLHRAIQQPVSEEPEEEAVEIPEATREDLRRQEIASEISRMAEQDPETVAALIRSWMAEEEG